MIRRWFNQLGSAPSVRKAFVLIAFALAGGFLLVRLIQGAAFFGAFMQGLGMAFAVMVVLAVAHGLLDDRDVEEAEMAGARVRFGARFGAARRAVGALERRLDAHARSTDQRLLDLERKVFKETAADSARQE
jgi:hypothetical protein